MKILFVISSLNGGGAERVLTLLANSLIKHGYKVTIVTYFPNSIYPLDKNISHLSVFDNQKVENSFILKRVKRRLYFYFKLFNLIKNEKPDIVISFIKGVNRKIIPIAKLIKTPIIVSEHTNFKNDKTFITYIERRWMYKMVNAVTLLTKYDYNNYYKYFLNNAIVIPNPVTFKPIREEIKKEKTILAVGSLERWRGKGFDSLLHIFSKIAQEYSDWKLKIAGGGNNGLKHLKDLTKKLNLENNVIFLGFIDNIEEELKKASIYVLSSRYEGFPMVLIEAMSQGCACVSYDCVSGPNEIITHNVDGILVEDQNQDKMLLAIKKVINDNAFREKLSKNATKKVENFSIENITNQWIRLFKKVIQ